MLRSHTLPADLGFTELINLLYDFRIYADTILTQSLPPFNAVTGSSRGNNVDVLVSCNSRPPGAPHGMAPRRRECLRSNDALTAPHTQGPFNNVPAPDRDRQRVCEHGGKLVPTPTHLFDNGAS